VEEDTANVTLVLPTHALLDLLELVDKSMKNDMALRSALTEQWEQLNNKFAGNSLNLTTLKLSPPKDE
jgi:hypothetical protein